METILITGGSGFIGSHTCVSLLENSYRLIIIDSNINSSSKSIDKVKEIVKHKIKDSQIIFQKGDIRDSFFLKKIFPWVVCVEELGYVAEDIPGKKINELMKRNGYKLGMRTFLSSIYIRKSVIKKFKSPFTKEWL